MCLFAIVFENSALQKNVVVYGCGQLHALATTSEETYISTH
jgi:hypothetical protein